MVYKRTKTTGTCPIKRAETAGTCPIKRAETAGTCPINNSNQNPFAFLPLVKSK